MLLLTELVFARCRTPTAHVSTRDYTDCLYALTTQTTIGLCTHRTEAHMHAQNWASLTSTATTSGHRQYYRCVIHIGCHEALAPPLVLPSSQ